MIVCVAAVASLGLRADIDMVGAGIWLALAFGRVLPVRDLLGGFGSEAVILVGAMMAVAEGLRRSGVTRRVGRWLLQVAGHSERRAGIVFLLAGAVFAAVLETTAATVALLPMIARLGSRSPLKPQRLYLLGALGAMAGGVLTLIGTSGNLVANGVLATLHQRGFGFLELAGLGLPLVVLATAYTVGLAKWVLPHPSGLALEEAIEAFRAYATEVRVNDDSPWVGRTLREAGPRLVGLDVLVVIRGGRRIEDPGPETRLHAGDVLIVSGHATDVAGLTALGEAPEMLPTAEGLIPPDSSWVGSTLAGLRARATGLRVLGIWRHGRTLAGPLGNTRLMAGDVLLARGDRQALGLLQSSGHVAWLNPVDAVGLDPGAGFDRRGLFAVGVLVAFVAAAASGALDLALAAFTAAVALVVGRCLEPAQGYAAVQWKVLVLLAGVIPLGQAISQTGLAEVLAAGLGQLARFGGAHAALAGLCLAATLLTQVLSNVPATAVLTPVAVQMATNTGLSPKACVAAVLACVLCTPLTGMASKPTILVREAGGYRLGDYLRFGAPFAVLAVAAAVILPPLLWPMR